MISVDLLIGWDKNNKFRLTTRLGDHSSDGLPVNDQISSSAKQLDGHQESIGLPSNLPRSPRLSASASMDSPCSVDYFGQLPVLDAIEPGKLLDLDALEWKLANANLSSDDDKDHSDSEETSPSPRSISTSSLTTTIVTPPDTQDKTSILLSPTPTRSKLKLHWLSQLLDKNKKKKKTTPPQHTHPTQETKALTWSKKKIASLGIRQVRAAPPTTAHALLPDYSREPRLLPSLERSIYRLSYTKCSQQRPLREQVMITNFMFWYLDLQGKKRQRQPSTPSSSPTLVNEKMPPVDVFPGKRPLPNRRASSHKHSLLGRTRHQ